MCCSIAISLDKLRICNLSLQCVGVTNYLIKQSVKHSYQTKINEILVFKVIGLAGILYSGKVWQGETWQIGQIVHDSLNQNHLN